MNNACDQCDCKAIQKQQVKIHEQSKHDDMKYTCDQCDDKTTRGGKTQNFPGSNILYAKTFRTQCVKPFLTTSQKSALLPLTTLPKNA